MRPATFCLALGLALLGLGCGEKLTVKNLDRVKIGMTQQEVKSILGNCTRKAAATSLGLHGSAWIYQQRATQVTVSFVNDGVVFKEGKFQK
jgi:outer membrane protein assembly factor BamE (lipoprotein component of BamABCDE complex)